MTSSQSDAVTLKEPSIHGKIPNRQEIVSRSSNKLGGKTQQLWFLNFYFSLHFVKMFEYIKSYLKMSNWPDIKFLIFLKTIWCKNLGQI